MCELLCYTEVELLGHRFHEITHPEDIEADWSQCLRLIQGEIKSFDLEKRYIRKDGQIVWAYLNCSVVTDTQDRPVHFITYIRDITNASSTRKSCASTKNRYANWLMSSTQLKKENGRDLPPISTITSASR